MNQEKKTERIKASNAAFLKWFKPVIQALRDLGGSATPQVTRDKIIENEGLVVPHPYIEKRKFVLVPLDEILPQFIHPKLQMPVHKLLELCIDKGKVEFFAPSVDLF